MAVDAAGLAAALGIAVADAADDTDAGIVEAGAVAVPLPAPWSTAYLRDPDDTLECPESVRETKRSSALPDT